MFNPEAGSHGPTSQPVSAPDALKTIAPSTPSGTSVKTKRTKTTASELEAKRLEKEAKEKERAEQKAKKEEERLRKEKEKEEEKVRKEQEKVKKEEEKRARDLEKEKKRQEREEQNKVKEEEQRKKQRSQLRLNAFFAPPNLANDGSTPSPTRGSLSPTNSRRSSITSIHDPEVLARERSISATPSKNRLSEYERRFPSFFLQSCTTLAPANRFERDGEGLQYVRRVLDDKLATGSMGPDIPAPFNPKEMLRLSPYKRRKLNRPHQSVREIVEHVHGTSHKPIDLTDPQKYKASQHPIDALKTVSTRILKFAEDVRPPYIGTYSRVQDPAVARTMCRNPFARSLPFTDYDYDSEAEWEEPGEGEDLDSEGEEEAESENGDDMEGFLDDEDAADGPRTGQKRRLLVGDLEPASTGLCWEDADQKPVLADLALYRLEIIHATPKIPIDPYSTTYWQTPPSASIPEPSRTSHPAMEPPRIPLNTINRTNVALPTPGLAAAGLKPPPSYANGPPQSKASQAPKRMVAPDVLEDFKRAVEGSDLTKAGLVEVLKKQFPKQSKDAIKDTIGAVADRVGHKEKDKRWVVRR
ncbi:MAG: hypothetical protein LQ345_006412 [Seirophora villosa]|nr:MAG: hypothetical protein LQ345_006412 [Seirophora villosa]